MRIIAPALITILLSGCVTPTQESYGVKITSNHDVITNCKLLGFVKASDHFFDMWFKGIAAAHVDTSIRNQAGRLGADTVLVTAEHTSWWTGSAMRAEAYDCKNAKAPETQTVPVIAVQSQPQAPTMPKRELQESVVASTGRYVYYTSALWDGEGREPSDFSDYVIGVYDSNNDKTTVLVKPKYFKDPTKNFTEFSNLKLSYDNKYLYFHEGGPATSYRIYKLDLKNNNYKLVTNGYLHCLVKTGKYKGDLIVSQHKYYVQGGSYNPISLFTPLGKKLGIVGGDDTTNEGIAQLCNHVSDFGID
ncbi:DUF4156 domain-containing protein [Salmonella enterica]|uniref:DUF4156 domain-containing protein n=1 Tax=Salmonella newport TaxID=108619 RepID=A0A5Y0S197_SALNE|nr:DUF4156 domain-containing protein [Salmonella enterica]EBS4408853.1 hypothetical protein [Salmonella enterica subsp. enterica serovar Newport]ECB1913846.1 DUF4156 domain-containing protein [Salmonella enterica subsp. enterica serovar Newport]ECB7107603.1 DUF4156 domain-containing protein [Salmonella enterica subsp. enterica serovar Newport]ECF2112157.1 DUF4156 domain-containing protein [Salmonella enterica subsp. enterica serovar Newport]